MQAIFKEQVDNVPAGTIGDVIENNGTTAKVRVTVDVEADCGQLEEHKPTVAEIVAAQADLDERIKSFGQDGILAVAKTIFDDNPSITGLGWLQYTDYFNDGDPCTFSRHETMVDTGELDEDKSFYEQYDDCWNGPKELVEQLGRLDQIPQDVYLAAFGDHQMITIRRGDEAFTVSDYSDHG